MSQSNPDRQSNAPIGPIGQARQGLPDRHFFHTLKVELVHRQRFATREAARRELFAYLDGFYNRRRLHSGLGYLTPDQKAAVFQSAASTA